MIDIQKRNSLKKIASIGTMSMLSGCCFMNGTQRIKNNDNSEFFKISNMFDVEGTTPVFDAHGHFFNVSDIRAVGYIQKAYLNDFKCNNKPYSEWLNLIDYIGAFLQYIGDSFAPSASEEWNELKRLSKEKGPIIDISFFLKQIKDVEHDELAQKIFKNLLKFKKDGKSFETFFYNAFDEATVGISPLVSRPVFNDRILYNSIYGSYSDKYNINGITESQYLPLIALDNVVAFLMRALGNRLTNVLEYYNTFSKDQTGLQVTGVANVMIDFDFWLGKCKRSCSNMNDQIKLSHAISEITNGYTTNVLAFNPWVAIEDEDEYFEMVHKAFSECNFKCAKIYPTIGYTPTGELADKSIYKKNINRTPPSQEKMMSVMKRFYKECKDHNVGVMTHGNKSKAAHCDFLEYSSPDQWKKVFEQEREQDKKRKLRVNIGHFGDGGHQENWTSEFADMMKTEKLYGDLGYWNLNKDEKLDELVCLLKQSNVSERVMYGTDWYMMSQEHNWQNYMHILYNRLYERGVSPKNLKAIFHDNAAKFFQCTEASTHSTFSVAAIKK